MAMTDEKPRPPYMVTQEKDAKLKAALHALVDQMDSRHTRIEIEGTGGLALRVYTGAKMAGKGPDGKTLYSLNQRQMHLHLVDKQGERLSSAVSNFYPANMEEDPEQLAMLRRHVADALVEGGIDHQALDSLLDLRQVARRIRVRSAREAAARLPGLEQDLSDAKAAFDWAQAVMEEEAPSL